MSLFKKSVGVAGLVVAIVVPLMLAWSLIYPWKEAVELLESHYPDQHYIKISGERTWSLKSKTRTGVYLVLPENISVTVVKINLEPAYIVGDVGESFWWYMLSIIPALALFVFFGVPGFRLIASQEKE